MNVYISSAVQKQAAPASVYKGEGAVSYVSSGIVTDEGDAIVDSDDDALVAREYG